MKTFRVLNILLLTFFSFNLAAQSLAPPKIWDKRFGGTSTDVTTCYLPLADGNFLAGGYSSSGISGDKTQACWGGADYWIVKIDPNGTKLWDKRFGGTGDDIMYGMLELSNGRIILIGYSFSPLSGDKSQNSFGSNDFWIVEIDQNGIKIWDKVFGGTNSDNPYQAIETPNHEIVIIGQTTSTSGGNFSAASYGSTDAWLIKIDTSGNLISQTTVGGTGADVGDGIAISDDGSIYIAVETGSSVSGNITSATFGSYDYLVCKFNSSLIQFWQKRFGSSTQDESPHIGCAKNKISVCGYTSGGISGNKTVSNQGSYDYWNLILDNNGNCISQRAYGGTGSDDTQEQIFVTNQNQIMAAGTSYSGIGGDKTQSNLNSEQTWVILFDTLNNLIWDRTVLDNGHEEIGYCTQLANGSYILGNYCSAGTGGDKTQGNQGGNDYFMICLAPSAIPNVAFTANQNICVGTCTNFSYTGSLYPVGTVTWSFPGGTPSTATGYNPTVCYNTAGNFPVQAIATNALGSDTLYMANYIHVLQFVNPVLTYTSGILICNTGATVVTFQWYLNNVIINGATDSTYTPMIDGTYKVIVNPGSICPQSLTYVVSNLPPYIQNMSGNMTYLCPNNCISFTATTFNPPNTYQWFFPGATPTTSTLVSPANICYPNPGTYDVTLIIHNAYGYDTLFYPGYIHVLNLTPTIINQNDTLICNTIGSAYQWYLNNTLIGGATNQNYVPTAPGNYQVLVTSYIGCAAFSNIEILGSPVASFTLGNNTVCAGQCTPFTNSSTNSPTSYQWTFAGGTPSTSTATSPTVCFYTTGVFNVQLIVSNQFGADTFPCAGCVTVLAQPAVPSILQNGALLTSSVTGTYYQWYLNGVQIGGANSQSYTASTNGYYSVEVFGSNGCSSISTALPFTLNTLPTAVFTADQTSVCQNFCISFSDQSLNTPNSWQWSFPGGSPSNSTQQNPMVCYYIDGTYDVTLITHNAFGYDTLILPNYITVYGIPSSTITYSNDTLFSPPGAFAYQWLLNGFSIAGGTNDFYVPVANGAYNVIVYNAYGCVGTNLISYLFNPTPVSSFVSGNHTICVNGCILFTNTTQNAPTSYQWFFPGGNPSTSSLANPTVCYFTSGNYPVELITANATGSDTLVINNYVQVINIPIPVLTLVGSTLTCSLSNYAGSPFTYQWYQNGILLAAVTDSFYHVTTGGIYNVNVTNAAACGAYTNDIIVNVSNAPVSDFEAEDTMICEGVCIDFQDISVNFPTTWSWTFAGGTPATSTSQNPVVCYNLAGNYSVTLIATNSFGSDTLQLAQHIHVQTAPMPTITQGHDTLFASGGASGYQWYNSNGVIPGATLNYYVPPATGIYNLSASFPNGCTAFNNTPYDFFDLPVPHISSSDTIICAGDCINFFDMTDNNPTNWLWTFTGAAVTTSTLQNPTSICFPNGGLWNVALNAGNLTGNTGSVFNSFVQVNAIPVSYIYYLGGIGTLNCSIGGAGNTYEWYLNGIFIVTAGTSSITPVGSGVYTCVVITPAGCRGTSSDFVYTGIETMDIDQINFSVQNENLVLNGCDKLLAIKIFNPLGQLLFEIITDEKNTCTYPLPLSDTRVYLVEAVTKKHQFIHQLIVKP